MKRKGKNARKTGRTRTESLKRHKTTKVKLIKVVDGEFTSTNKQSKQVASDAKRGTQGQHQPTTKDWLLNVSVPKSHFPEPVWVRRLRLEWCQACESTVTWRSEKGLRGNTGEEGATVGSWLAAYLELKEHHWNEFNDEQRRFVQTQGEDTKRLAAVFFEVPRWQAAEFFKRFTRALEAGCFDPSGLPKSKRGDDLTWPIKRVMVSEWPSIKKLGSTKELCDFLLKKLPAANAKGIEEAKNLSVAFHVRVQKICVRCGLHFKKRGRPRKK